MGRVLLQNVLHDQAAFVLLPELAQQKHVAVTLDGPGQSLLLWLGLQVGPVGP